MQLLIILALLLYGGKSGSGNLLSEVKPILETVGGEEVREALKSAEQISSVLSAVQTFAPLANQDIGKEEFRYKPDSAGFPLAPVSAIADRDITYSLSRYIAQS